MFVPNWVIACFVIGACAALVLIVIQSLRLARERKFRDRYRRLWEQSTEKSDELRTPLVRLLDLVRSMDMHRSSFSMGEIRQWELRAHEASTNESITRLITAGKEVNAVLTGVPVKPPVDLTDAFRELGGTESTAIGEWPRSG